MIASIISRYTLTLSDTVAVADHALSHDSEYNGKGQIVLPRKPVAEEDDFILLHDGGLVYQGIISEIENADGHNAYTITAVEMPRLFDRKVILAGENLLATGIEDFIADQIRRNFIESEDSLLNIDYLTVTASSHTPVAAMPETSDGIYNLCTYLGNALTNYGIFIDFVFSPDGLNVVIEKKEQSQLDIDTSHSYIVNLEESYDVQVLAKLTVLWQQEEGSAVKTRHFFLKTDKTITENMNDPDRAKGSVDVITSTAKTEEELIQAAHDSFKSNAYQHKIGFDVIPSRMLPASDLYVGHTCRVKTGIGIKDSIITAIEQSKSTTAISVTLGQMKVTLIEKLKGVEKR